MILGIIVTMMLADLYLRRRESWCSRERTASECDGGRRPDFAASR